MTLFQRLTLLALCLLLIALPMKAQETDNTVTLVLSLDPQTLDPQGIPHPSHAALLPYIYDRLVFQDSAGIIQPYAAESWTVSDDGLEITFNLRDDITFSNGAPLNADAVIYTFERLQEIGQRSLIYGEVTNITGFEKVDDYTVRFQLAQPSVTLLSALSYPFASLLEPGAVEAAGEAYGVNPVGSGPYMLDEWIQQNNMNLVPNPNYNGQRPTDDPEIESNIDQLQIRFTTEEATRVNALMVDEVDIAFLSSASQLDRVTDNPDFTLMDDLSRGLAFVGFNTARPPFDNLTAREAVAYAIDKQTLVDIVAPGVGQVTNLPIPPSIFGYNAELEATAPGYDPEMAREKLAEAGYGDGLEISILTSTFPANRDSATVIQAQLADIGINAEIEVLDFAAVREQASAGDYDILVTRYNWNDPDLLRLYLSAESISAPNYYFYDNPELDALTTAAQSEYDTDARFALYTDAQRIVIEQLPWIPLYMPITKVVYTDRLENVTLLHTHVILDDTIVGES